jgi:hypothetical protein
VREGRDPWGVQALRKVSGKGRREVESALEGEGRREQGARFM